MESKPMASCAVQGNPPVVNEIMQLMSEIVNYAEHVQNRVDSKLSGVTLRLPTPNESIKCGAQEVRIYPPLFDEMRGQLNYIRKQLWMIEETIDCTEL